MPVKSIEEAAKAADGADAVVGFCTADIVKAGKQLRWIQLGQAGSDQDLSPELLGSKIILTDTERLSGPQAADQAFALLLGLTRRVDRVGLVKRTPTSKPYPRLGLAEERRHAGGIARQDDADHRLRRHWRADRDPARGFGMRVRAVDPRSGPLPEGVLHLADGAALTALLPEADVVVLACPLTGSTRGLIGSQQLGAMKKTAYLINVADGRLVRTADLVETLEKKGIAGAGLDAADPEPLPDEHPLWKLPNTLVSPRTSSRSPEGMERQWRLWRENVRRFVEGEALLCVVERPHQRPGYTVVARSPDHRSYHK